MVIEENRVDGRHTTDVCSSLYENERTIFLTEAINAQTAKDIVTQIRYLSHKSKDDITLCICSPGGEVSAGMWIYDEMNLCGCDIQTVCCGIAASMGAFLFAAGTKGKRIMMPSSELMLHQVMGGTQGQASDIVIAAEHITRMKQRMNKALAAMCGHTVEQMEKFTDRDHYLNAEEAVSYGIADRIQH